MQSADQLPIPTLAGVTEGFAQWRASGESKYRTPQHLQQQTVALLRRHPKSLICKSLSIPYSALKQWALHIGQSDAVIASQLDTATPSTGNAEFVQLPTTQCPQSESISDDQSPLTPLRITLPNGATLSTSIPIHTLLNLINQPITAQCPDAEHRA